MNLKIFLVIMMAMGMSSMASGSFKNLAKEFLNKNTNIQINKYELQKSKLDLDLLMASKTWSLTADGTYDDNELDTGSSTNASQLKTKTYGLDISKDFRTGTTVTLGNTFTDTNKSRLNSSLLGENGVRPKTFKQEISLSQDLWQNFFGRDFKYDIKTTKLGTDITKGSLNSTNQNLLLEFYNAYIDAKLSDALVKLQKEALRRSNRRLNITSKRVRDGLNEKADLYQARMNHITQQENLDIFTQGLKSNVIIISNQIQREVSIDELDSLDIDKVEFIRPPKKNLAKNIDLKVLKRNIELLENELGQIKNSFRPSLNLTGSYITNAEEKSAGDSFSDGNLTGDHKEYTVAVSFNMPLGYESEKVEKAQKNIELISKKMEYAQTRIELEREKVDTQNLVDTHKRSAISAKRRIELAKKSLNELNRLYNLGRTDLDRVIRAEEDLISTQKSFVEFWAKYKKALAREMVFYGELMLFLVE